MDRKRCLQAVVIVDGPGWSVWLLRKLRPLLMMIMKVNLYSVLWRTSNHL